MPQRNRVDGMVSSTKTLSLRGQIVDGIRVDFENGVAVRATASRGEQTLRKLLATDEGASRLGEVALVPHFLTQTEQHKRAAWRPPHSASKPLLTWPPPKRGWVTVSGGFIEA